VTGYVLERTGQFYWAFVIAAGMAFASAASWVFLVGRVEPVIWKLNACRRPAVSREVA
jgi:ACS family D-galactonate transporter-like MFS transporter